PLGKHPDQRCPARARARSRKTKRIARGIASFEANLMNAIVAAFQEEIFVKRDAAVATGVQFHHPTVYAIGIELLVPRGIKRVREIDSFAVAAHFHHLGAASERLVWLLRMRRAIDNAANAHRSRLLWIERIGHVVLQHLPGSPARDV